MKVTYIFLFISLLINANNAEVGRNCEFATSLLNSVLSQNVSSTNVILAPFSLSAALAMLYLDATGETASELLIGMHLTNMHKYELILMYKEFFDRIAHQGVNYTMANRLYFDKNIILMPTAVNATRKIFNSDAVNIDLKSGQYAADEINQWAIKTIPNKISEVITKEIFYRAHGVLVTVTYLNANWKKPFPAFSQIEYMFEISNGNLVPAIMSTQDEYFAFSNSKELDAKLVLLPLENSTLSVLLLLPNQLDGLPALERRMKYVNITELPQEMSEQYIRLTLPQFKVSFNKLLRKNLRQLGIKSIFQYPQFETLTNATRAGIIDVVHKVDLEIPRDDINERIPALLSVYNLGLELGQWLFPPKHHFLADHPFLFYVMDADMIHFVGHFTKV